MLTVIHAVVRSAAWLVLSFVVVVAVLALLHDLPGRVMTWQHEAIATRQAVNGLLAARPGLGRAAEAAVRRADQELSDLRHSTVVQLDAATLDLAQRKALATARILTGAQLALAAARGQSDRIVDSYKAQYVDLPLIERATQLIALRKYNLASISTYQHRKATLDHAIRTHNAAVAHFNKRVQYRNKLSADVAAQLRNPLCRQVRLPLICSKLQSLRELDAELSRDRSHLAATAQRLGVLKAAVSLPRLSAEALSDGNLITRQAVATLNQDIARQSSTARGYVWNQAEDMLRHYGGQAFLIVLGALVMPVLHKLVAFYLIAPLAAGAAPVRLRAAGPALISGSPAVAIDIPVDKGTELLVRSNVLDRPRDAQVRSLCLLTWRMPFACLAAGLFNLQRFRTDRTDRITVSGTDHDHFEVALIEIPEGGAVVLQPRALVGVLKPRHRSLIIRRPWRLRWLISWITFQFRYIVFYGPCTLIVQGKRGVRTKQASAGRATNKRLVLGFDASLDYGAARAASFRPYLFGQASLFDDSFSGAGQYIYEERSASEARGSIWGRGIKGIGDAVLSALGI